MILESTIKLDFGLDEMYNKYLCFYLIALTFKSLLFMLITLLQNYFISCYSSKLLQGQYLIQFSCSVVPDSLPPHGLQHARFPCPSPNSQSLLKLMSIELVMPSDHLILCHPLFLLPSNFPSIFSNESVLCISGPEYWRFSFSISPSNEYSGMISFRIDCFDLGTVVLLYNSLSRVFLFFFLI